MKKEKTILDKYAHINRIIKEHGEIVASDGTELNLMCMPHHFKNRINHLPEPERIRLTIKYDRFIKIKSYLGLLKRYLNKQDFDLNYRLLEIKKAEILEMFGSYYSFEEIHKKLIEDTGINLEISNLRVFHSKYRLEIEKLQSDYDKNIGTIGITKKRSRLEQLDYMIRKIRQEFDNTSGKNLLPYSKEIKGLLEQARKEVEGEKLHLNVDGSINISATIESIKSIEDLYADLNFNQLLVAMMAKQQNVNPLLMHHKMLTSYYSKYTGFNKDTFDMNEVIDYPSKLITGMGWEGIRDKVEAKEIEEKSLQDKFDIYIKDYFGENEKGARIREDLKNKVHEYRTEIKGVQNRLNTPKKDVQEVIAQIKKKRDNKNL